LTHQPEEGPKEGNEAATTRPHRSRTNDHAIEPCNQKKENRLEKKRRIIREGSHGYDKRIKKSSPEKKKKKRERGGEKEEERMKAKEKMRGELTDTNPHRSI
jgi:hypothetical protein